MKDVVFITGNAKKAEYLSKFLGCHVDHQKVELEEIQSLDLHEVVKHKLRAAYKEIQRPVLVEDVALEFKALGKLPGTFIKFFLQEIGHQGLCDLLIGKDRSAVGRSVFGYYDGDKEMYFEGSMEGRIPDQAAGDGGYGKGGWDSIFIPEEYKVTRAEMNAEDDERTYKQMKPLEAVRKFLMEN